VHVEDSMDSKKRLGDMLVEAGYLSATNLDKALKLQVGSNRRLGYLLIKMGLLTEKQLHSILAGQLGLPMADLSVPIQPEVKQLLPRYLCTKYGVLPLRLDEHNTLALAMVDPSDSESVNDIEKYTGKVIQPMLAVHSDIERSIRNQIPWSFKDLFNAQTSSRITAGLALFSLLLILILGAMYIQDKRRSLYGSVITKNDTTRYENLELILGFNNDHTVSLVGHGAHSPGYYSITFDNLAALEQFLDRRRADLSSRQWDWVEWVIAQNRPPGP
jgi:hypothetical protein